MLSLLKDKTTYSKVIIKTLPLVIISATAISSLTAGIISLIAVCLSAVAVTLLKPFLNERTAPFAKIIISIGVVGSLTMLCSLFMKEIIDDMAVYLPLISLSLISRLLSR